MQIKLASLFVNDQNKALQFYTGVLGFQKKLDFPMDAHKWLTVVSPEDPDGTQLLLGPNNNPAAKTYQEAIFSQGIPAAIFFVSDIRQEYERLKNKGVRFVSEPAKVPGSIVALLDDTCGNIIAITQVDK